MAKKLLLLLALSICITTRLNSQDFYEGLYFGSGYLYNNLTDTGSKNSLDFFLGSELTNYLNLEAGFNYGLAHKNITEKCLLENESCSITNNIKLGNKAQETSLSYFYLNLIPKYKINQKHSLLFIASIAYYINEIKTTQGYVDVPDPNIDPSKDDEIKHITTQDSQSDIMYGIGLGYEYKTSKNISLTARYKYNFRKKEDNFNLFGIGVKFFMF